MTSRNRLIVYGAILAAAIPMVAAKLPRRPAQGATQVSQQAAELPPDAQAAAASKTLNVPQPTTYREYLDLWHNPAYHSQTVEKQGLADPFKGITTNGTITPGCFRSSRPASRPSRCARRRRRTWLR